jgi:hypothetical protein
VFYFGKRWRALHFLLTGDPGREEPPCPVPPPLGNVVLGGTLTPLMTGYGPVRSLSPEEVRAVAEALRRIPAAELGRRFDPVALRAAGIDAPGGSYEDLREWLLELYPGLVGFFVAAAAAGDLVLLSLE